MIFDLEGGQDLPTILQAELLDADMSMAASNVSRGYSQMDQDRKAPRTFKDVEWIGIFFLHLVCVVALGCVYTPELIAVVRSSTDGSRSTDDDEELTADVSAALKHVTPIAFSFIGVGVGISIGWSLLWVSLVQRFAKQLIKIALLFMPVLLAVLAGVTLLAGSGFTACLLLFLCGIFSFYAYWIFSQPGRIEFAQLTLESISAVVKLYPGTYLTAFFSTVPATVWQLGWFATLGATGYHFISRGEQVEAVDRYGNQYTRTEIAPEGKIFLVFLCLSQYWTAQVIQNVVHVTTSGVVATWYFRANAMPTSPSLQSFKRATTTSFGSICLGSLLVALVQLLKDFLDAQRRNSDSMIAGLLLCCITYAVSVVEALLELFNHWAFVQVAIYGKDFKTAAKDTLQLVRSKGLDGLVNQNLTRQAVGLGTLVGMVLSGAIVALISYAPLLGAPLSRGGLSEDVKTVYQCAYTVVIVVSAILGALFAGMISTTINSGVTTLFVCWAEQPAELLESNPELHRKFDELTNTYLSERAAMYPQPAYGNGV